MKSLSELPVGCKFKYQNYGKDIPKGQKYPVWIVVIGHTHLTLAKDTGRDHQAEGRDLGYIVIPHQKGRGWGYLFENYWHAHAFYLKLEKEYCS